jgi:hypothetical protein
VSKVIVNVAELRSKSGNEAVNDLRDFLKEKLQADIDVSGDELALSFDEEKGKAVSRSYLRMLLRKFLHKTELKEDFRVIAGKESSLVIKEKKVFEVEE